MKKKLTDEIIAEAAKQLPADILDTAKRYEEAAGSRNNAGRQAVKYNFKENAGRSHSIKAASVIMIALLGMAAVIIGVTVSRSKKNNLGTTAQYTDLINQPPSGNGSLSTDPAEAVPTPAFPTSQDLPEYKLSRIDHYGTVPQEFRNIIQNNAFARVTAFSDRLLTIDTTAETAAIVYKIRMTDLYGVKLAEYEFKLTGHYSVQTLTATKDGGFLFVTGFTNMSNETTSDKITSHVIKCDSSGNVQFDTEFERIKGCALLYCFEADGCFYFFGSTEESYELRDNSDIYMAVINADGKLIRSRTLDGSKSDQLRYAEVSGNCFLLSTESSSDDGDYSGFYNGNSLFTEIIFTVDRDLSVLGRNIKDHHSEMHLRVGEKDGRTIYTNDPIFCDFDAGTPIAYIDYGDFYLVVSNHITGLYPYQPPEISTIWYCYETVYSAYDTNGILIFRSAIDDTPQYTYTYDGSLTPTAAPTEVPTAAPTEVPLTVPVTGYFKLIPGGQQTARSIEERGLHCQYCFVVLSADGSGFYNWFGFEYELEWRGEQLFVKETGEEIRYEYDSESGKLEFKRFGNTIYAGSELTFERSDETAPRRNEYTFFNEITGKYNTPYQRMDEITFSGETVIDNELYYLRLIRIALDEKGHYIIYMDFYSRSDKHLYLSIDDTVVNGVAYGMSFHAETFAVSPPNANYLFFNNTGVDAFLIRNGLADPTVISFNVEIYEREGGTPYEDRTVLFSKRVTIYPFGEENARMYEYVPEADDVLLADNDYFSLYLTGLSEPYDEKYTPYMDMILINKTGDKLWLAAENLKINGVQLFEGMDGINDDRCSPTLFSGFGPDRISLMGWSWDYYLSAEEFPELVGKVDLDTVHTVEFDIVVCDKAHLLDYKAVCRATVTVDCG